MIHSNPNDNLSCIICGGQGEALFKKQGFKIVRCQECDHLFAFGYIPGNHVETIYGDSYFLCGGAGYPNYLNEGLIIRQRGQRYAKILTRYMPCGRILDVGAAAGFFLMGFIDSGWTGEGVEPNTTMVRYAQKVHNLAIHLGTIENFATDEKFDLISMIQVIAHFVKPSKAIDSVERIVRPGGFVLVETWNRESWTAKIMGRFWHEFSPPSVLHWFTPTTLTNLFRDFGFREVAHGRLAKKISGAHMKSILSHALSPSRLEKVIGLITKAIPDHSQLYYPSEDLFFCLYQKKGTSS